MYTYILVSGIARFFSITVTKDEEKSMPYITTHFIFNSETKQKQSFFLNLKIYTFPTLSSFFFSFVVGGGENNFQSRSLYWRKHVRTPATSGIHVKKMQRYSTREPHSLTRLSRLRRMYKSKRYIIYSIHFGSRLESPT